MALAVWTIELGSCADVCLATERTVLVMRFYALQVTCETCKSAFLVGGANENDLHTWRDAVVECSKCGAACRARDGQVVDLTSQRCGLDTVQLVDQLTPV